jgi:hypothetical protein
MRACFLGQNVCALGYGVAMVQTCSLVDPPHQPTDGESEVKTDLPSEEYPLENLMVRDLKRQPWRIA